MKYTGIYTLFLLLIYAYCDGQNPIHLPTSFISSKANDIIAPSAPSQIARNIRQDRSGNIWIAAFDGVFRYNGKSFTNMTSKVSSGRFFSVLEDRKGNLWFGSIGSGVYRYDGKSFQNFTTREGLVNNEVNCIYEDKTGNIWFGINGGISRYDGKSFQNYLLSEDSMTEDKTGKSVPDFKRPPDEVNSIIEDQTGRLWFATRGNTFVYDGKTFTTITHDGKPFKNARTVIKDKKGIIWLGGADGLWRYDGNTFNNLTMNFTGYIYEDRKGNVWTSSETAEGWALSRYDEKSLSAKKPTATEIKSAYEINKRMIFGILEANDGSIWFGSLDGVYRYDGNIVTHFKSN